MAGTYRVVIMPRASKDLATICAYIEQDSPQNAASVAQELLDAIDSLGLLPHRYKVHRSNRDPSRVVRSMPVPPFVIYYQVLEQQQAVEVITVRHGSRRQPRRFE